MARKIRRRFSKKRDTQRKHHKNRKHPKHPKHRKTMRKKMRGGVAFSPASYPVGNSWNSGDVNSWAGVVRGVSETGNHLPFKGSNVEPHPESSRNNHNGGSKRGSRTKYAGYKKRSHRRSKRILKGGSRDTLMPQSLVNLGRNLTFGAGDLINTWSGKQPMLSPSPTVQPIANTPDLILPKLPNVPSIHAAAGQSVADI